MWCVASHYSYRVVVVLFVVVFIQATTFEMYTLLHINPDLGRLFGDGVQIPHAQAAHTVFYVCAACGNSLIKSEEVVRKN